MIQGKDLIKKKGFLEKQKKYAIMIGGLKRFNLPFC